MKSFAVKVRHCGVRYSVHCKSYIIESATPESVSLESSCLLEPYANQFDSTTLSGRIV